MANVTLTPELRRNQVLDRSVLLALRWVGVLVAQRELVAYGIIVAAGFVLRIWDVGGRAMHHDESLHAYYAWQFFTTGVYTYNPLMHGPLQFEVAPLFYLLFGDNEMSSR